MQLSHVKAIELINWVYDTKNYCIAMHGNSMFDKSAAGKQAAINHINSDSYDVNKPLNLCFKMNSDSWDSVEIFNQSGFYYAVDTSMGGRPTAVSVTMHGVITRLRLDSAAHSDFQPVPVQYIKHDPLLDINDITQRICKPSIKALTPNGFTFIDANINYGLMLCNDHRGEPIVLSFCQQYVNGKSDYVLLGSTHYRLVHYPYGDQHKLAIKTVTISKVEFNKCYQYGYEVTSTYNETHVLMLFTKEDINQYMMTHDSSIKISVGLIDFLIE